MRALTGTADVLYTQVKVLPEDAAQLFEHDGILRKLLSVREPPAPSRCCSSSPLSLSRFAHLLSRWPLPCSRLCRGAYLWQALFRDLHSADEGEISPVVRERGVGLQVALEAELGGCFEVSPGGDDMALEDTMRGSDGGMFFPEDEDAPVVVMLE